MPPPDELDQVFSARFTSAHDPQRAAARLRGPPFDLGVVVDRDPGRGLEAVEQVRRQLSRSATESAIAWSSSSASVAMRQLTS